MALKLRFNPFTNQLDWVDVAAPTPTPPAGADGQLQFNNNGEFGASASLTFSGGILRYGGVEVKKVGPDFTSTDQAIVSASTITVDHSLGVVPTQVWTVLVCVTDEFNYVAGDLAIRDGLAEAAASRGLVIIPTATQILVTISNNGLDIINKTSGAMENLTEANWLLRIHANR